MSVEIKSSTYVFEERRGRKKAENPFVEAFQNPWKPNEVKEVVLKNSDEVNKNGRPKNVVAMIGQIRTAAAEAGVGVRIETDKATVRGKKVSLIFGDLPYTHTVVYFSVKERTVRPRKAVEA